MRNDINMIENVKTINGRILLQETTPRQLLYYERSVQLFVNVTASGIGGWGQVMTAAMNLRAPYVVLISAMGKVITGMDEDDISMIWEILRRRSYSGGYGVPTGAQSGIDIALWDIKGKKLGIPICKIFGSAPRKVKRYASLIKYADADQAYVIVKNLIKSGYERIKLHQPPEQALDVISRIRKEFGYQVGLMADLNCALKYDQAKDYCERISKYEPLWVEEPLWPVDDFKSLAKLNKITPIAAGENFFSYYDYERLLELEALAYYQPDLTKLGGITPAIPIINLLKVHGANIAFHNRPDNSWIGAVCSTQMASAMGIDAFIETPPNEPPEVFDFQGRVDINEIEVNGNGLGITPKGTIPEENDL
ncbi:MAG: mandelate racemase/muconate lactonizing enzyme family protein [Candidatus Micrarchaeaceae archaeon]